MSSAVHEGTEAATERHVYVCERPCPHCGEMMLVASVQAAGGFFLGGPQSAVESHVAQMAGAIVRKVHEGGEERYASVCPECGRTVNRRVERHAWIESITKPETPIVVKVERDKRRRHERSARR